MTDRELFEAYRNDVYYLCHYMLQNAADAEDVCQEVFVKAFQTDRTGIASIKPWLIRIAVNRCKNHLGRRKLGSLKEIKLFLLQSVRTSEAADEAVLRMEGEQEIRRWLLALPVKIRAVMTNRFRSQGKRRIYGSL